MEASAHSATPAGPNPPCEVGRRHPRDKHRMRPVEGHEHTWHCDKHSMFAQLIEKDAAASIERGDEYPMHDGGTGIVMGFGDERLGGIILYYRAQ